LLIPSVYASAEQGVLSNKPASVSAMRCVFGTSWNNKRLNFVPLTFQVKAHLLEYQSPINIRDTKNIFCDDEFGFNLLYCSKHLAPQVAFIICAFSFPGKAEGLA
jgi:hypothetical protein